MAMSLQHEMSKKHKKALISNRVKLVTNLIIDEVLLSIMMAEKSIITAHMKNEIQVRPSNIYLVKSFVIFITGLEARIVICGSLVGNYGQRISMVQFYFNFEMYFNFNN